VEAIVLAGGFGTRLQSVVSDVPKPMAPINQKPFLEYILRYLKRNGIRKVILSIGYKWEVIQEYFGENFENIAISYVIEDEPLGTGGAIKKALKKINNKTIYILNGDTFFNISISLLSLSHNDKIQIALKSMYEFDRYGCVETDEYNTVTSFTEKGYQKQGNINGGIYLIDRNIFENYELPRKFSFEEFMQNNFKELKIKTRIFEDYFIDIGVPEDYKKAQIELEQYI